MSFWGQVDWWPACRISESAFQHAEDVLFPQDEVLFAVDLHLGARVLAEQDLVAGLDLELANRAVLEDLAVADGDDHALDRLLLGRVRNEQAALGLVLAF